MNEDTKDTRMLPVVAWQVEFPLGNGAKVYEQRPSWAYESYGDLAYVTHELCRLTDAQARLAEKDARIAQLAAHARGKNKALANALKEIERLRLNIAEYNEHERCWRSEIADLRAQLQAAPAERGVAPAALSRAFITSESVDGNYRVVIKSATLQETQQVHNWLARLNPAPATADSDVRGVK